MDPLSIKREHLIVLDQDHLTSQYARKRMTGSNEKIMLLQGDYSKMEAISLRNSMMLLIKSRVLLKIGFRKQIRNFQD